MMPAQAWPIEGQIFTIVQVSAKTLQGPEIGHHRLSNSRVRDLSGTRVDRANATGAQRMTAFRPIG